MLGKQPVTSELGIARRLAFSLRRTMVVSDSGDGVLNCTAAGQSKREAKLHCLLPIELLLVRAREGEAHATGTGTGQPQNPTEMVRERSRPLMPMTLPELFKGPWGGKGCIPLHCPEMGCDNRLLIGCKEHAIIEERIPGRWPGRLQHFNGTVTC